MDGIAGREDAGSSRNEKAGRREGLSWSCGQMLSHIIKRLERIGEKIDANVDPPEPAIRPEIFKQVKKAQADIRQ